MPIKQTDLNKISLTPAMEFEPPPLTELFHVIPVQLPNRLTSICFVS